MASTADEDARANVLKSLGVARRRAPDAVASSDDEAEPEAAGDDAAAPAATADAPAPEAAAGATISGLGIKRRKPATTERPAAQVDDAQGDEAPAAPAGASGLGIKRRKGPDGGAAPAAADAGVEAPPAGKRRRLGSDQAATILANYFRGRPNLELPDRVWDLKRTHGFYNGDGRPERKLFVGFEPALVLYVIPCYPEKKWPDVVKQGDEWVSIDPGLHRQPRFTSEGFIVDEPYNELGEGYVYVAFQSDGQPLELADTTAHVEPERKRGAGAGLGIKRRK